MSEDSAFCCADLPEAMAERRAARLAWMFERRICADFTCFWQADSERLVVANCCSACDAEVITSLESRCPCKILFICNVSFSRVDKASWMQSSRFESRIKASNEDVGSRFFDCFFVGRAGGSDSLKGRSVKLVYIPSER